MAFYENRFNSIVCQTCAKSYVYEKYLKDKEFTIGSLKNEINKAQSVFDLKILRDLLSWKTKICQKCQKEHMFKINEYWKREFVNCHTMWDQIHKDEFHDKH